MKDGRIKVQAAITPDAKQVLSQRAQARYWSLSTYAGWILMEYLKTSGAQPGDHNYIDWNAIDEMQPGEQQESTE